MPRNWQQGVHAVPVVKVDPILKEGLGVDVSWKEHNEKVSHPATHLNMLIV
jgi:hypothetical protein